MCDHVICMHLWHDLCIPSPFVHCVGSYVDITKIRFVDKVTHQQIIFAYITKCGPLQYCFSPNYNNIILLIFYTYND